MCVSVHDPHSGCSTNKKPLFSNCSFSVHTAAIIIWYPYIVDKDEMRCGSGAKGSSCARDTAPFPGGSGCAAAILAGGYMPRAVHGVPSASGRAKKLRGLPRLHTWVRRPLGRRTSACRKSPPTAAFSAKCLRNVCAQGRKLPARPASEGSVSPVGCCHRRWQSDPKVGSETSRGCGLHPLRRLSDREKPGDTNPLWRTCGPSKPPEKCLSAVWGPPPFGAADLFSCSASKPALTIRRPSYYNEKEIQRKYKEAAGWYR